MDKETHVLKSLLQDTALKEPLREALMTLALRIEPTYPFMGAIRAEIEKQNQAIEKMKMDIAEEHQYLERALTQLKTFGIKKNVRIRYPLSSSNF